MSLQNTGRFRPQKSAFGRKPGQKSNSNRDGRLKDVNENIRVDGLYGFYRVNDTKERIGFLINMHATEILEDGKLLFSGMDYYFLEDDCTRFKISLPYRPYFYILCRKGLEEEISTFLLKKYDSLQIKIEVMRKEDLDMPNHLIGLQQKYLKLSFINTTDLNKVRREIMSAVKVNREREKGHTYYSSLLAATLNSNMQNDAKTSSNRMDDILDIREYDVPHHVRVSIDTKVFCGAWYSVKSMGSEPPVITRREDIIVPPDPIILAYDIETTKLPLKFPDANTDQVMMISYMIDGQGFLITNREIISADVEDFEYTPKPEFEGHFTVFNEPNEKATIRKFFDHINEIKPHIFVSYNGDFFDWPFLETRAAIHNMEMKEKIGFEKNREGIYVSRPAMHMDCLSWVKRDSYLPVGSQNLKAVAKAKLRYNPIELDPEDMCRLASEQPEVLANYSVSDAVATYYLYYKYVHPFIFALCTIIPMEPDEVLRKGSGTLCESLLMVQAFQANIIFPNKYESELNKLTTDGHVLDQETYVGGHVEALESGVFRADIPCRFKIIPSAVDKLIDNLTNAMHYAIQEEEKVPIDMVTNFDEVANEIKSKLMSLKNQPLRLENPVIYHLDVAAMYPNIILTNRLQPSAMVDETVCGACDFNKPQAICKREMKWMWRGDYLAASLGEYQRIQQQLETEKFPPQFPNGPRRAFNELSKEEQASYEKKRLSDYCRKAYKKVKITRTEERTQTICQRENSFYVDTVRAFRDRRYEYKALTKVAKQQVAAAVAKKDAAEIKSAKSREVLYDSLQLAHKCILNSFYGYVMRKGSRWYSMEMGGIVCYTGAHIIMKAREIIEQIGRPLELDTDGIWCVLPASFPDNVIVKTTHPKKSKLTISYPNAILNFMVKDYFTNDSYHELVDSENLTYTIRSENSIFFEVDGPYLAMVLPAAKEEGKKLKKRYAVFNFDGSLAELKGFEVKRRGELQLIKIFQSSVFESFLKGSSLDECYASVAKDANYWLDVLYSKCADMPDTELFELISENKSMSRKLEEYGGQKSTSISTAKRLAEFLGDQMVKDAGLNCKYIISEKPNGAPVTERAIPLAIFQSEPAITKHYLRKWLKDSSLQNIDIREILDWNYYIERLGSAIQKIITIPAAMQGISNPVPRVRHPDWLHKKIMEKNSTHKQMKITDLFSAEARLAAESSSSGNDSLSEICDMEDFGNTTPKNKLSVVTVSKRKRDQSEENDDVEKNWRQVLGPPPPIGDTKEERLVWLEFHKKKWAFLAQQRRAKCQTHKRAKLGDINMKEKNKNAGSFTLSGFLRRAQKRLFDTPWQIIQLSQMNEPGMFRIWVLVENDLQHLRLIVPRIFYVNVRKPRSDPEPTDQWKKCSKILPRSRPVYNLYRYSVPEAQFLLHNQKMRADLNNPDIEGIYETQVSLEFRAILELGCVCIVDPMAARKIPDGADTFTLDQLLFKSIAVQPYLKNQTLIKYIFLYHHWSSNRQKALWGLFLTPSNKAHIFAVDTVSTHQLPNMNTLYSQERTVLISKNDDDNIKAFPETLQFIVKSEKNVKQVYRILQAALKAYKDEGNNTTVLVIQTPLDSQTLLSEMPFLNEFPIINTHIRDLDTLYSTLDWQRLGAKTMFRHYLKSKQIVELMTEQARYFHVPIGNIPADATLFGADLFYARHLQKNNFVLWCSPSEKPDWGGIENTDNRLLTDLEESTGCVANHSGTYSSLCIELEIENLAVNTLLQYQHVNDIDGTSSFVAFHNAPHASLQDMVSGDVVTQSIPDYDETALCTAAFKILRGMVSAWLRDVSMYKNIFADHQIIHFCRWLRSPHALLYDPGLQRTLHGYMKKLFIQLISEFKRLGCIIVYASFNKIILCTKKRTISEALEYTDFVVQTIRNKELFHSIEMTCEQGWNYLIWLDLYNHAGVRSVLPTDQDDDSESQEEEDDVPEIVMSWSLKEILPQEASCEASFSAIIAGYITAIYKYMCEKEQANSSLPKKKRNFSQTASQALGLGALENTAEFAKKLINGDMSQKLFQIVEKIHKKLPVKLITFEENPNIDFDGEESKTINPALELTKAVCKVLSLDREIEDDVGTLRTNLLRLIKVGNFSAEAEWKDPCISFILPQVICKICNHTKDLDLFKDGYYSMDSNIYTWKCLLCQSNYDNTEIEFLLIDTLNRKSMAYILQDLSCVKCSEIKRENLNKRCTCTGEYTTTMSNKEILKIIKICKSISKKCNMQILSDVIKNTGSFKTK